MRAFGTEDRPTPTPISPRGNIYDYIIFKATDIKDLVVCEKPKMEPDQSGGLSFDPAIVSFFASSVNESTKAPSITNTSGSFFLNTCSKRERKHSSVLTSYF